MANSKIVSANYLNPESNSPWLLRDIDHRPEDAQPYKVIKATGVEFTFSTVEEGFGCAVVACCEKAEGYNTEEEIPDMNSFIELKFDGRDSFKDSNGNVIKILKTMYLDKNRKIWGEILVPEPEVA